MEATTTSSGAGEAPTAPLLDVRDLSTHFRTRSGTIRAVDGVSFQVHPGETLGLVGESGSGKSVTCLSLLGLVPCPPGWVAGAHACFHSTDLLTCSTPELRHIRGRRIAMVFQDPMTSLNPYLRVSTQVVEPLVHHLQMKRAAAFDLAVSALEEVGLQDAGDRIRSYPHEFSGGMRQRVMIAMALIVKPEILIADEPTTALDVTVQAQILDVIGDLQRERGMSVILVTHDLGVVAGMCDRVVVMYAGRVLETAPVRDLFRHPGHPYTQALQRSLPSLHSRGSGLYTIPGSPPNPLHGPITGCPFAPRCDFAAGVCNEPVVSLPVGDQHTSACVRRQRGDWIGVSLSDGNSRLCTAQDPS